MLKIESAIATWTRFSSDESGADIVEYAVLAALIGIVSIVIWQQLVATVGVVYTSADTNIQIKSGCTPDPISAGGGCS